MRASLTLFSPACAIFNCNYQLSRPGRAKSKHSQTLVPSLQLRTTVKGRVFMKPRPHAKSLS